MAENLLLLRPKPWVIARLGPWTCWVVSRSEGPWGLLPWPGKCRFTSLQASHGPQSL